MRARVWLVSGLVALVTACGLPSASPTNPGAPPSTAHVSARFLTNPLAAAGGAPIAVAPVSGTAGFILSRANSNNPAGGILLTTSDGGKHFTKTPLPANLVYEGLYAASADTVAIWAETQGCIGEGQGCTAEVLVSRDGGRKFSAELQVKNLMWLASASYSPSGLWLAATTPNCSGSCQPTTAVYTSSNGGQTWSRAAASTALPVFAAIGTTNGTTGYGLAGPGSVYRTTDGGRSWVLWTHLSLPQGLSLAPAGGQVVLPAPGVIDISTCNGAAAGGGGCPVSVFVSTDGGRNFQDVLNWNGSQEGYLHMATARTGVAIMTGQTGGNSLPGHPTTNIAIATTNGFSTTTVKALPLNVAAVAFRSALDGWAVGSPSDCLGNAPGMCPVAVATTTDGGTSWSVPSRPPLPVTTVGHPAKHMWWGLNAAGNGGTLFTSPNGRTWTSVGKTPGTTFGDCGTLNTSWVSRRVGFLVAGALLFQTTDGGRHWTKMPAPPRDVTGIWFGPSGRGYAVAGSCTLLGGSVYATTDGGRQWARVGPLPSRTYTAAFTGPGLGYALQSRKTAEHPKAGVRLMRTTDGGRTWQAMAVSVPASSPEIVGLPGGSAAIMSFGTLLVVRPDGSTTVVKIQGTDMSALMVAGLVPVSVSPSLEFFLPGVGLFGSPWGSHMRIQGPLP